METGTLIEGLSVTRVRVIIDLGGVERVDSWHAGAVKRPPTFLSYLAA
jgi:anti-anti-sigma regulatory factor